MNMWHDMHGTIWLQTWKYNTVEPLEPTWLNILCVYLMTFM